MKALGSRSSFAHSGLDVGLLSGNGLFFKPVDDCVGCVTGRPALQLLAVRAFARTRVELLDHELPLAGISKTHFP